MMQGAARAGRSRSAFYRPSVNAVPSEAPTRASPAAAPQRRAQCTEAAPATLPAVHCRCCAVPQTGVAEWQQRGRMLVAEARPCCSAAMSLHCSPAMLALRSCCGQAMPRALLWLCAVHHRRDPLTKAAAPVRDQLCRRRAAMATAAAALPSYAAAQCAPLPWQCCLLPRATEASTVCRYAAAKCATTMAMLSAAILSSHSSSAAARMALQAACGSAAPAARSHTCGGGSTGGGEGVRSGGGAVGWRAAPLDELQY